MSFNIHRPVVAGLIQAEQNRENARVMAVVALLKIILLTAATWSICHFQLGFWSALALVLVAAFF